jgi:8-oxo-dGTP pyrophosphatase MutT (NUDIX family)
MTLTEEIRHILAGHTDTNIVEAYKNRLQAGALTREENPHSHFCGYFVPFNKAEGKVLIGSHKKSGLWLMPGGHIEPNEPLLNTLNREIEEELGVKDFYTEMPEAFLLTITHIVSDVRPCKEHFDMWFLMETDGKDMVIDYTEYHEVRWATLAEARELTKDPANLEAIGVLGEM